MLERQLLHTSDGPVAGPNEPPRDAMVVVCDTGPYVSSGVRSALAPDGATVAELAVAAASNVGRLTLHEALSTVRTAMIADAIARHGTFEHAARILGVSRQAIQQALRRLA